MVQRVPRICERSDRIDEFFGLDSLGELAAPFWPRQCCMHERCHRIAPPRGLLLAADGAAFLGSFFRRCHFGEWEYKNHPHPQPRRRTRNLLDVRDRTLLVVFLADLFLVRLLALRL